MEKSDSLDATKHNRPATIPSAKVERLEGQLGGLRAEGFMNMSGIIQFNMFACLEVDGKVMVMLPHEVLALMRHVGDPAIILDKTGLDRSAWNHLAHVQKTTGDEDLLGIGFWGDSVPNTWDRSSSVEVFTWSLPGQAKDPWRNMRVLFCALPSSLFVPNTMHALMEVWTWSMTCLFQGQYPTTRHNGDPWHSDDGDRAKLADQPLKIKGILCEVRGDWKFFKAAFDLPGWHPGGGPICWRCKATKAHLHQVGHDADIFKEEFRLSHADLVARMVQEGKVLSPLWGSPFFQSSLYRLDWLHIMDKGVGLFFLGGVFKVFITLRSWGNNENVRQRALWEMVVEFYKRTGTKDRLNALTLAMIKALISSLGAAEVRALIPFGVELAAKMVESQPNDPTSSPCSKP